jgi:hypothetical protein
VIVLVPGATPVTTPVDDPMIAAAGLLLTHVPPVVVMVSTVEPAGHTCSVPPIAPGSGFTVTTFVAVHAVPVIVV